MTFSSMNLLQLILLAIIIPLATPKFNSAPNPGCQTTCGNLNFPFPFGTTSECCLDDSFLITCDDSHSPPKPFLNLGTIEILDISLDRLLRVPSSVASDCYNTSGSRINGTISKLNSSKFPISSTRNKFTAVGCDTYALMEGSGEWKAGCMSWCNNIDNVVNGTCSGIGCCQTSVPKGVKDFLMNIQSFSNHTNVNSVNPCGYAFLAESEAFEFSSLDLWDLQNRKTFPVVLDWSVGNITCLLARENPSSYACRASHSECSDSNNGLGYNCNCLKGYQGNPYFVNGCEDIDECITPNPCEGSCVNLNGSYSCSCPEGFGGDGRKNGSGCHQYESQVNRSQVQSSMLLYVTSGFMIPAFGISWILWRRKQKKLEKQRNDLFRKNGGAILEEMQRRSRRLSFFSAEELKRATNNYDEDNIIRRDHRSEGIEYKGELPIDGEKQLVTVMKCCEIDQSQIKVYISKLVSLSLLHHTNVVKLIGCCLETQVPLLVYEFITVKTLHDCIHEVYSESFLTLDILLKIAKETAEALACMHSADPVPIIHGNLNSSNILIQSPHTAKVQVFAMGSSFAHCEYLDRESLFSGTVTIKSDIYSFGVVMAEILIGKNVLKKPVGQDLAEYFVSLFSRDEWIQILSSRMEEGSFEQLKQAVKLVERCLSDSPVERPTMTEVAKELGSAISTSSGSTATRKNSKLRTTVRRLLRWPERRVLRAFVVPDVDVVLSLY